MREKVSKTKREWCLIMGGTKKDQGKVIRSNSSVVNLMI